MKLNRQKRKNGFTLLQMILTVMIVGIVARIAIPAMNGSLEDSRTKKVRNALNQVDAAKIHYFMDTKNAGEPPLGTLASYINNEANRTGGAEIFYTKQGWVTAGNSQLATSGALLGGVKGNFRIKANAKGVAATYIPVPIP